MKNSQTQISVPQPKSMSNLFVEGLARTFRTGIYYPVGHVVLDQGASKFVQQVKEMAAHLSSSFVRIDVTAEGIRVGEEQVPLDSPAARELHLLFDELGMVAVEFDRTLLHKHFLLFLRSVLGWRRKVDSARKLIQFELNDLPDTIRVEQKEFVEVEGGESPGDSAQNLEGVMTALASQGLNENQLADCRYLLDRLSRDTSGGRYTIRGYPNVTWKDVETLLHRIVTTAYSDIRGTFDEVASRDINIISSIFSSLARDIDDGRSRETIEILVSHLSAGKKKWNIPRPGGVRKVRKKPASGVPPEKNGHGLSVNLLQRYVRENNISLKILGKMHLVDRGEVLSIVLMLFKENNSSGLREGLQLRLRGILAGELTPREREVLTGGVRQALLEEGEGGNQLLDTVIDCLRDQEEHQGLGVLEFLVTLWGSMPNKLHLHLWPRLVKEMLRVGLEGNEEWFYETLEIVSHLPVENMRRLKSRLELSEVIEQYDPAPVVFRPGFVYAYRFYGFLLETVMAEIVAEQVVEGCKTNPQDIVMKGVSPFLDPTDDEHLSFLRTYLLSHDPEEIPLSVQMAGGGLINDFLANLSEEMMEAEWLADTISAAGELGGEGTEQLLKSIVSSKKLGLVHVWPKNCRRAAEAALKKCRKKNLKDLL